MKQLIAIFIVSVVLALPAFGQQQDTTAQPTAPATSSDADQPQKGNVFTGGTLGLSFGHYFRIAVQPMIGYSFNPKFSAGLKLGYEYINDKRYEPAVTWNNYGASVFGRFRFIPQAYLHAEFAYVNYGAKTDRFENERVWVPFLYLGGGYIKPISQKTSLFIEVLVDVLQDSNSPYEAWQPMISFGVVAGI